jgi:hypothetical protein
MRQLTVLQVAFLPSRYGFFALWEEPFAACRIAPGLKPNYFDGFLARLKPCPDTKQEFFGRL